MRRAQIIAAFLLAASVLRADPAAETLLVVNRNSSISQRIGEHYQHRRAIPPENVCRVSVADSETVDRAEYAKLAEQVGDCIKLLGLDRRIVNIVTTKGTPLRINGSIGKLGDAAAVDSELSLLYRTLRGEQAPVKGRLENPFFGRYRERFDPERFRMYLTTRLTGYDFDDVRALIDRASQAKNEGFFVVDPTATAAKQANIWLRAAARALPQTRVIVGEERAPVLSARGVIAFASWGSNDPERRKLRQRKTGFDWLPGAIVTAYVSTDGRTFAEPPADWRPGEWNNPLTYWKGSPQSLAADLIREGVSGVSGHVYEPYLDASPRPNYLFPAYYEGRSLAESFYLAIPFLSWMNIVVGDPLCSLGPPDPKEGN